MTRVHYSVILFNFSLVAIMEMLAISLLFSNFTLPTNGYTPYMIFALALLSYYAQILLTKALQIEEAGIISLIRGSTETIFSFAADIIIFGNKPDQYSIIGAVLVFFSVILLTFRTFIINLPIEDTCRQRFNFLTY